MATDVVKQIRRRTRRKFSADEDLAFYQTSRRPVEENTGPLGAQRGSGIEPAKELERLGWIARGSVAVPLLDLAGVLSMGGRALGITRKRSRVPDPELRRDEPDHSIGNLRRARQEDAEESDRPQLDCKPEPILIPSARGNHRTIMGVEMKVPSELLGRRLSGILAVGGSLRFAQEVDRHRCPEKGIVFGERIGTDPMLLLWTESVHNISQRPFR